MFFKPRRCLRMDELIGKKVWVVQYDDEDSSVVGFVVRVANGFIALRIEEEEGPSLWVNSSNVKEIELIREPASRPRLRLIRFPGRGQDVGGN